MPKSLNINNLVRNTIRTKGGDKHFARPAGSTLSGVDSSLGSEVVKKIILPLAWEEVTDEVAKVGAAFGKCKYFRAHLPDGVVGQERIALLSELNPDDLARVRVVKGNHGFLQFVLPEEAARDTKVVHMIVGHPEDPKKAPGRGAIIYTWYPGRVTPAVALESATVKFI